MPDSFAPTQVEDLAAALPPNGPGANPIANRARGVLINRVKAATPGNYSQMIGTGPTFRSIFFPGYGDDPAQGRVDGLTGLGDGFWRSVSVAALVQRMWMSTSRLRPQLRADQLAGDLGNWGRDLRSRIAPWYAYVASVADSDIKTALAKFSDDASKAEARAHYMRGLTSESWINDKVVQDSTGNWPTREWELYHHWIKLLALNTPMSEIDATIETAAGKGLPVPPSLRANAWRSWTGWFGDDIGANDIQDAIAPILKTNCHVYPGSRVASCMAEDNSFEFTANGQPGNGYRTPPKTSCFAPGTKVVAGDGTLKPIEDVRAGDVVLTADGPRQVILHSTPPRGDRPLYRFGKGGAAFVATHPFVVDAGAPEGYAAVDPEQLARVLPNLAQFGITSLGAGPTLVRHVAGGQEPYHPPAVEPADGPAPAVLHDLVVEIGDDGSSTYFAGDDDVQVLVSSELPRFGTAPLATWVVVNVLQEAGPAMLEALASTPDEGFTDLLGIGLDSMARTMLPRIGRGLLPDNASPPAAPGDDPTGPGAALEPKSLAALVEAFAASMQTSGDAYFAEPEPAYNTRLGSLVGAFIETFGPQFQAAIRLGWRTFDTTGREGGMLLGVTVYSVELFDRPAELPASDAAIEVTLVRDTARSQRVVPVLASAPSDRWFYPADAPVYFDAWRPIIEPPAEAAAGSEWRLELRVVPRSGAGAGTGDAVATVTVPWVIDSDFEALTAPVLAPDGRVVGQAHLDLRSLSPGGLAEDLRRRAAWHPDMERDVALRLAKLASAYLRENFGSALFAFQKSAATPAGRSAQLAAPTT